MKKLSFIFFILFTLLMGQGAKAYVQNQTRGNFPIHWSSNISLMDIFVNSSNTQGLSSGFIQAQAQNAVNEWDGKSRMRLRKNSTNGTGQEGLNEIYFSVDPEFFNGTAVVGVTQVNFKDNNGEILEADILVNDDFQFSTDVNESSYLGNVLTHEMGHFLGLGHSQVMGSTMFYTLSRGQSQLADDDKAGIYSLYPTGDTTKGVIAGKIVGGNSLAKVFGAHVQAVSLKTGKIAASSISNEDGGFVINGLMKNDQYYLYIKPIEAIGLPDKYSLVKKDFCESSKAYRGSFFQACGSSSEGYPQAVKLNSSQVNVGNVTIRCGLDVPTLYMQSKNLTPATFDIQSSVQSGVGNSFTGYFSNQEIALGTVKDYFRMNYSGIDWDDLSATGDLFVELKVINQALFSPFKANITVKRNSSTSVVVPKYTIESDGWPNIETTTRIAINRADPSDNDFEIVVAPESMKLPSFPTGIPYSQMDYFPSYSDFGDPLYFYLVSASIVKDNGDGTFSLISAKNEQLSDNTQCPDAVNTYAISNVKRGAASVTVKKKDQGIACGSIDTDGNNKGGGAGGFFVGMILSLIIGHLSSSAIRHYKLRSL